MSPALPPAHAADRRARPGFHRLRAGAGADFDLLLAARRRDPRPGPLARARAVGAADVGAGSARALGAVSAAAPDRAQRRPGASLRWARRPLRRTTTSQSFGVKPASLSQYRPLHRRLRSHRPHRLPAQRRAARGPFRARRAQGRSRACRREGPRRDAAARLRPDVARGPVPRRAGAAAEPGRRGVGDFWPRRPARPHLHARAERRFQRLRFVQELRRLPAGVPGRPGQAARRRRQREVTILTLTSARACGPRQTATIVRLRCQVALRLVFNDASARHREYGPPARRRSAQG